MKRAWIRSTLFNLAFYVVNAVCCIAFLPALLLPRPLYLAVIQVYHYLLLALEYTVLGLHYEIRGKENLPKSEPYIVAAKHMSPYETLKLRLLFDDPAIVLKKELLRIPLWGAYLKKSDVIAIDRSTPDTANKSITEGALRMKEQGRPVVIFPQGTRVWPDQTPQEKPYKGGIHRIQEATGLPVIPMATNSGLFWPRSGWLKSPGKVIFEFLDPIEAGLSRTALINKLEKELEEESISLMNEAKMKAADKKRSTSWILFIISVILFGGYTYLWYETAHQVKTGYVDFVSNLGRSTFVEEPKISGFPGPIRMEVLQEKILTQHGEVEVKVLHAIGWPIPFTPVSILTGPVSVQSIDWPQPVVFDGLQAELKAYGNVITVLSSTLRRGEFEAGLAGTIDLKQKPVPRMDLLLTMKEHQGFLMKLAAQKIIKTQMALFMSAGFTALMDDDGVVRVALTQRGRTLYAGPLPVAHLPELQQQVESPAELPRLEPYNQLGPDQ